MLSSLTVSVRACVLVRVNECGPVRLQRNSGKIFALQILFQFFSKKPKGVLPIAEYEGSPRRFGNYQQDLPHHQYQSSSHQSSSRMVLTSPMLFPPRPGFPQVNPSFEDTEGDQITSVYPLQRVTSSPSSGAAPLTDYGVMLTTRSPTSSPLQYPSLAHNRSSTPSPAPQQFDAQISTTQSVPPVGSSQQQLDTNGCAGGFSASKLLSSSTTSSIFNQGNPILSPASKSTAAATTTFDYLYEFSETRKVLEDFFKCPNNEEEKKISDCFNESDTGSFVSRILDPRGRESFTQCDVDFWLFQENLNDIDDKASDGNYIGQRLAKIPANKEYPTYQQQPQPHSPPRSRYAANNYENHQVRLCAKSQPRRGDERIVSISDE